MMPGIVIVLCACSMDRPLLKTSWFNISSTYTSVIAEVIDKPFPMLKNYFKIAIRNLWKSKGFSFINIAGLAVGMASAVLIILWIANEVSYDTFHEKKDRIYQAWNKATFSGKLQCWNTTPKPLAKALKNDIPEVEEATRINRQSNYLFSIGEKRLTIQGNIVDSNFLKVFSF